MFAVCSSKRKGQQEEEALIVAEELFSQIGVARDEAKAGRIISEQVFNERLNDMYSAGYLIGYVDSHLSGLKENADKRAMAERVFEAMFPGNGLDFVKGRLDARRRLADVERESNDRKQAARQSQAFDHGMEEAAREVERLRREGRKPRLLKDFLLLGQPGRRD